MTTTIILPCGTQLTVESVDSIDPVTLHLKLENPNGTLEVECPKCGCDFDNLTNLLNIRRDSLKPVIQFLTLLYNQEKVER